MLTKREKRIANGVCVGCNRPPQAGSDRCGVHVGPNGWIARERTYSTAAALNVFLESSGTFVTTDESAQRTYADNRQTI